MKPASDKPTRWASASLPPRWVPAKSSPAKHWTSQKDKSAAVSGMRITTIMKGGTPSRLILSRFDTPRHLTRGGYPINQSHIVMVPIVLQYR